MRSQEVVQYDWDQQQQQQQQQHQEELKALL